MNSQLTISFISEPKNQLASVLKMLIESNSVSEQQTPFNGFRSRISDLRLKHDLNVRHVVENFTNQFGRESSFRKHFLYECDKEKALKIYQEINK